MAQWDYPAAVEHNEGQREAQLLTAAPGTNFSPQL